MTWLFFVLYYGHGEAGPMADRNLEGRWLGSLGNLGRLGSWFVLC